MKVRDLIEKLTASDVEKNRDVLVTEDRLIFTDELRSDESECKECKIGV